MPNNANPWQYWLTFNRWFEKREALIEKLNQADFARLAALFT